MNGPIVDSNEGVTLVGGGQADAADLHLAMRHAPVLVAADGGAGHAVRAGLMPRAVVGDFDSLDAATRAALPAGALYPSADQNSTDFDKAMAAVRAPLVLGVGFLGLRVDHQLAAFSTLLRCADRSCVLIGAHEVVLVAPPRIEVALRAGDVVSIYPLRAITGRSIGLHWPIDGLRLAPEGQIGTSNRATGPVTLEFDGPGGLLILPRDALDAVIAARPRPWPAPAPSTARA